MTDMGTHEMAYAVLMYCDQSRTEGEVVARIRQLSTKADKAFSESLLGWIVGKGWLGHDPGSVDPKALTVTMAGKRQMSVWEREGFE